MPSGGARIAWSRGMRRCAPLVVLCAIAGCKSDLNQQLLERELRYQEDQIYHLQDELEIARSRLQHSTGENASLRRQLGVDGPAAAPRRVPARSPSASPAPVLVPPAIQIPDAGSVPPLPRGGGTAPPAAVGPPTLEGVPPLPGDGAGILPPPALPALDEPPLALPPAATGVSAPSRIRPLAFESPAEDARPHRLVVNPQHTVCIDADGDGRSEGLSLVFEPRDAEERLVAAPGDVRIVVHDTAAGVTGATGDGTPIASWQVGAAEVAAAFRRTSRQRGVVLSLPWPTASPTGDHVRVVVTLVQPGHGPIEADATIATR